VGFPLIDIIIVTDGMAIVLLVVLPSGKPLRTRSIQKAAEGITSRVALVFIALIVCAAEISITREPAPIHGEV
jgi:hypothetical protein